MPDQDIVRLILKFAVGPATAGVDLHLYNHPAACSVDGRAGRHLPIDGVLIGAAMAVAAIIALSHFALSAGFVGKEINHRIIMHRAGAPDGEMVHVTVCPLLV